jgi:hypothetical protein
MEPSVGPALLVGFVVLVIVLTAYAAVHWSRRRKALAELLPSLGWQPVAEPSSEALLPALLFHPNGFDGSGTTEGRLGQWEEIRPRVTAAWTGTLAGLEATLMDVSIHRIYVEEETSQHQQTTAQLDATVLRCDPGPGARPPDFLIDERVRFKSRLRGTVALDGETRIGEHYFLFSGAGETDLAPWVAPRLRELLAAQRLWTVATHDGAIFLSRRLQRLRPDEIPAFLSDGASLVSALLVGREKR